MVQANSDRSRTTLGTTIGIISLVHGVANLVFHPFLFYVLPYQWSAQIGLVLLIVFSLFFIVGGAFAYLGGRPWSYGLIALGCLSAMFQYISSEFAYSFMGPLFFKVGSSVMTPQPWVNLNLLPLVLAAFVSKGFAASRQVRRAVA
jgi:hypothetical protein